MVSEGPWGRRALSLGVGGVSVTHFGGLGPVADGPLDASDGGMEDAAMSKLCLSWPESPKVVA